MADGTALTIRPQAAPPARTYDQIKEMASAFAESGMFGVKTKSQAFSLLMMAEAEGLHPARALQEYHVIQGRPSLKAEAMLARYQAAGGTVKWTCHTDDRVAAIFTHPSSDSIEIDWDMDRAKQADIKANNYLKYPRQMLRARTISEGVRASYPGCIVGHYTPEEVQEFEPLNSPATVIENEPVEAEVVERPALKAAQAKASKSASRDLFAELQKGLRSRGSAESLREWGKANKARIMTNADIV